MSGWKRMAGVLAVGLLLSVGGCSSQEEKQVRALRKELGAGHVQTAFVETTKLLAEPGSLKEEHLAELRDIKERAEEILTEYYASSAAMKMVSGELDGGLKVYEEALERLPRVVRDLHVNQTAMRAYVAQGKLANARRAAANVVEHATDEQTRASAKEFLVKVDELEKSREVVKQLRPVIDGVSAATGTAFNEMPSMTCMPAEIDKSITPEVRDQIVRYFSALDREQQLMYEIGRLTPMQAL